MFPEKAVFQKIPKRNKIPGKNFGKNNLTKSIFYWDNSSSFGVIYQNI